MIRAVWLVCVVALAGSAAGFKLGENFCTHAAIESSRVASRGYELPNTAVHTLSSGGRRYQVWVDVPRSYGSGSQDSSGKRYPVVFVTDASYAFPIVRSIRNLLGAKGQNIEDFILVGLDHAEGDTSKAGRSRDYTPSNPLNDPLLTAKDSSLYGQAHYGEAAAFRDYIEREVFPLIANQYRADMQRKVYVGHSFGGLFGAFVLVTKPTMFQAYILGSPSLWFDDRMILRIEESYASHRHDLLARVIMYAGSYETIRPEPRYFKNTDLIRDMQSFERNMQSRRYPHLQIESRVIPDEDHLSVFPALVSRGLLWALPGFGPYTSG